MYLEESISNNHIYLYIFLDPNVGTSSMLSKKRILAHTTQRIALQTKLEKKFQCHMAISQAHSHVSIPSNLSRQSSNLETGPRSSPHQICPESLRRKVQVHNAIAAPNLAETLNSAGQSGTELTAHGKLAPGLLYLFAYRYYHVRT